MSDSQAEPTAKPPAVELKSNCPPGSFDELVAAFVEGLNAAALANIAAMAKDAEARAIANRELQPEQDRESRGLQET